VLQRSRLDEAVERVAAGEEDRAGLALDLGFADQAHFTNAFRLGVGRPPSHYGRTP
jgi:AraC-like DNA-binding protein